MICYRVEDLPIPLKPAQRDRCDLCRGRIWVGYRAPKKPRKVCYPCAFELIRQEGLSEIMVVEGQLGPQALARLDKLMKAKQAPK